jgi:hypothetical protein
MEERQQKGTPRRAGASPLPQVEKGPAPGCGRRGATRRIGGYYASVVSRYFADERCQVSKRLVVWPKGPLVRPKGQLVSLV